MLGHASAAMTLDVYADLFDDDLDVVAEGLDRAARAAAESPAPLSGAVHVRTDRAPGNTVRRANVGRMWANPGMGDEKPPESLRIQGFRRAETEGFEPSVPLRGLHLSRVVH